MTRTNCVSSLVDARKMNENKHRGRKNEWQQHRIKATTVEFVRLWNDSEKINLSSAISIAWEREVSDANIDCQRPPPPTDAIEKQLPPAIFSSQRRRRGARKIDCHKAAGADFVSKFSRIIKRDSQDLWSETRNILIKQRREESRFVASRKSLVYVLWDVRWVYMTLRLLACLLTLLG
jgi:hypothetical protein